MIAVLGVLAIASLATMLVAAKCAVDSVSDRSNDEGSYQHYLHGVNSDTTNAKRN